jgi:hypothetical protein
VPPIDSSRHGHGGMAGPSLAQAQLSAFLSVQQHRPQPLGYPYTILYIILLYRCLSLSTIYGGHGTRVRNMCPYSSYLVRYTLLSPFYTISSLFFKKK